MAFSGPSTGIKTIAWMGWGRVSLLPTESLISSLLQLYWKNLFHCPTMSSYKHYLSAKFCVPLLNYEILEGILNDISVTWNESLSSACIVLSMQFKDILAFYFFLIKNELFFCSPFFGNFFISYSWGFVFFWYWNIISTWTLNSHKLFVTQTSLCKFFCKTMTWIRSSLLNKPTLSDPIPVDIIKLIMFYNQPWMFIGRTDGEAEANTLATWCAELT